MRKQLLSTSITTIQRSNVYPLLCRNTIIRQKQYNANEIVKVSHAKKQVQVVTPVVDEVQLFSKKVQTNSDLFLRDASFIVKDALEERRTTTQSEQDRSKMLVYALHPCSLSDSDRKELVVSEAFSYVSTNVINTKQITAIKKWLQTVPELSCIFSDHLVDPHLVKCFVSRTMLKRKDRNVVYEFDRSNLQLEMQGLSHLRCVVSSYLNEFMSSANDNETLSSSEQLLHVNMLMTSDEALYYFANKIGLDAKFLTTVQDLPQQRTGVDIVLAIFGQINNLLGVEASQQFLYKFAIPKLLQIIEDHPVPKIVTEDLVRDLSVRIYKQNPVLQTRKYKLKNGELYSSLVICNKRIKGQGLSQSPEQSVSIAWQNAYEQMKSEEIE